MGLGGVAIAVPPYVIHPKTAVLGRAGGGNFRNFLVERNILVRYFADFINVSPTIHYHFIHKDHSRRFTIIFERK